MPLSIDALLGQTAETDMTFLGETLHVIWSPSAVTPALEAEGRAAEGHPEKLLPTLVSTLVKVLRSWDLLNGSDKPYPITTDALNKLPVTFLWDVWNGLLAESVPKETSEPPSPDS